jgi:hypothetical protein
VSPTKEREWARESLRDFVNRDEAEARIGWHLNAIVVWQAKQHCAGEGVDGRFGGKHHAVTVNPRSSVIGSCDVAQALIGLNHGREIRIGRSCIGAASVGADGRPDVSTSQLKVAEQLPHARDARS